ncbi:MAG: hypothetical protein ACYCYP_13710, partial [Leptospirales bacterium]
MKKVLVGVMLVLGVAVAGCSSGPAPYSGAFDEAGAPAGAPKTFTASQKEVFQVSRWVLIRQGFSIQKNDEADGIVSGSRDIPDQNEPEKVYSINTMIAVTEGETPGTSLVTISANESSVLHEKHHTWWHLLWLIPIFPTGTVYQTIPRGSGSISDPNFYQSFYTDIGKTLDEKN